MYSFKNIYSENINSANLAFVTGPTKYGKSWLLRYNLRKFQASQQNPIVLYYDMRAQGMISFDMFLHSFEKMIIETLV
jgi:predicted AAA+ superfamily ATPase